MLLLSSIYKNVKALNSSLPKQKNPIHKPQIEGDISIESYPGAIEFKREFDDDRSAFRGPHLPVPGPFRRLEDVTSRSSMAQVATQRSVII